MSHDHDPVEIRDLRTHDDYLACVALQEETWGEVANVLVPVAILKVSQRIGGVTAGAFDESGRLVGFVFGMTGLENGVPVHWSDMLAVRPGLRDQGIGRRLKEHQRQAVAPLGVENIYWTYDPLVARNANLNFSTLGARLKSYEEEMYGEGDSPLHRGIGTDRLVVSWPIDAARQLPPLRVNDAVAKAPLFYEDEFDESAPSMYRIAIPLDIHTLMADDLKAAQRWRSSTRRAFQWGLARGYTVHGFFRNDEIGRGYYLLAQGEP
jgi:predicted GNAT superfamily acetyltransferase